MSSDVDRRIAEFEKNCNCDLLKKFLEKKFIPTIRHRDRVDEYDIIVATTNTCHVP